MTDFFARHLSKTLSGHESVFTHSDFQRKNILIADESPSVVAVVDWESAGWYPSYWGYALCFTYFDWSDDWPEKVEKILEPYIKEAAIMRIVGQDLDL